MKHLSKKISCIALVVVLLITALSFTACQDGKNLQSFYNKVVESQKHLDTVADDIYSYWYDAIYEDAYYGSINIAIATALSDNSDILKKIESNDPIIQSLYKEVRDSKYSEKVQAVMSAYSDYYELVVNVSGSFNTYSANKEAMKKELASALRNLALEL